MLGSIIHKTSKNLASKVKVSNNVQKPLNTLPNDSREFIENSLSDNSEKLTDVSLFVTNFEGSFSRSVAINDPVTQVKKSLSFKDHISFIQTILTRTFGIAIISFALAIIAMRLGQLLF